MLMEVQEEAGLDRVFGEDKDQEEAQVEQAQLQLETFLQEHLKKMNNKY